MPGITREPTPIGEAIRDAREARGVSGRKLCAALGKPVGTVSRWETGDRPVSVDDVEEIITELELDGEEADNLRALAGSGQKRSFAVSLPERRAELAELLRAERTATYITYFAPLLVPGVLQTADVIRAQMHEAGVPEDEVEERVVTRIGRRDLITRRDHAHLDVLLGETAIRQLIGGPAIWADQLRYLLEMGELPNVELRLVPYTAGWSALLIGAFQLIDSKHAPSIVSLDLHGSGLTLRSREDVVRHRRDTELVREQAIDPAGTAALIAKVLHGLEHE